MKRILIGVFIIPLMMFAACEKQGADNLNNNGNQNNEQQPNEQQPEETPKEVTDAYNSMAALIEEGDEYDITDIKGVLYGKSGYWRVEAIVKYNEEYTMATAIIDNFDDGLWSDSQEPVIQFVSSPKLIAHTLSESEGFITTEEGEWSFAPRTLGLTVSYPTFEGNEALNINGTLVAASNKALVIDYLSPEGEALRAAYASVDYKDVYIAEANEAVPITLAKYGNYDTERASEWIAGEWIPYTELVYDADWQRVVKQPAYFYGECRVDGGGATLYTFNADGSGTKYITANDPSTDPITYNLSWIFDKTNKSLTISGDVNKEFKVVGAADDLLILDHTLRGENVRSMLKRANKQ